MGCQTRALRSGKLFADQNQKVKLKQVVIGKYCIGREYVEIVLREGTGADYWLMPEHGHIPRIKVGADVDRFDRLAASLLHELTELVYDRLSCRFDPTNDIGMDHSTYVFIVPHVVFSDACTRVAECLIECLPDIKNAWEKWHKKGGDTVTVGCKKKPGGKKK